MNYDLKNKEQSFEKHTDSVLCCAINPANHEQIVTGGQDNKAFFFNYTKPDQVQELTGHNVPSFYSYLFIGKCMCCCF